MFRKLIFLILLAPLAGIAQTRQIHLFQTDNLGGPSQAVGDGSSIYFTAWDSVHGRELWISDGSEAGTKMVKDIRPGLNSGLDISFEYNKLLLNGILYFRASNGVNGFELWRSDGTAAGTWMLKELGPGTADGIFGNLTAVGSDFYFTSGVGQSLWKSDGTTAGTFGIRSFSIISNLYGFNGILYFSADAANNGQELWRSNGTQQGTFMLKDLNGVTGASLPCNFHATANRLYFMAATNSGWELWRTNGTAQGTYMVKDINPGGGNSVMNAYNTVNMNHDGDTLYFRADDGVHGYQLWKSDGSVNGTVRLSNVVNGLDPYGNFPIVNNKVLFNNYSVTRFYQYNKLNGTVSVSHYPSETYFNGYYGKYIFNNSEMYYAGRDSVFGAEILMNDGSNAKSSLLQETHLVNNFTTSGIQGFNTIAGIVNDHLLFIQARTALTVEVPMFSYDLNSNATCFSPSRLVPVRRNNTEMFLVWNRTGADEYRVRYKSANALNWTTKIVSGSYLAVKNLTANTTYQFQVRAICNGAFQPWSDTITYSSSSISQEYILTVLADRPESSTVHRIWWEQTSYITSVRIRYRVSGTANWTVVGNSDGMMRITNLQPSTLYEYQYKPMINGIWDAWSPAMLYFMTDKAYMREEAASSDEKRNSEKKNAIIISPNPASDHITITGKDMSEGYKLYNLFGQIVQEGLTDGNSVSIENIPSGVYLLDTGSGDCKRIVKL